MTTVKTNPIFKKIVDRNSTDLMRHSDATIKLGGKGTFGHPPYKDGNLFGKNTLFQTFVFNRVENR